MRTVMVGLKPKSIDESDAQWVLPFADLMTLLLVIFVTLAAMSDLRPGRRFNEVSGGVRAAFGFGPAGSTDLRGLLTPAGKPGLVERLEQAGLTGTARSELSNGSGERLAPCEMVTDGDRVTLRVPGDSTFDRHGAVLRPEAERLLVALAGLLSEGYLTSGRTRIEIHGYAGDGPISDTVAFRDAWDLSYERGKAVADTLVRSGIARGRISVTAMGDQGLLTTPISGDGRQEPETARMMGRRIEITVRAAEPGGHVKGIADKEATSHG
ncbi:MAG: OmpA family protein [Phycisphaerae bacterium]|nr:OmpA family protein [Phycisphaerae bacterium]